MEDEVDWSPGGDIVVSSSSYEAHQAEVVTLKEVNGRSIALRERLLHRHIGKKHIFLFEISSEAWTFCLRSHHDQFYFIDAYSFLYLHAFFLAILILQN